MREIALKLSALFLFLTIVIGTFAEISQPKEGEDGYLPKGEYISAKNMMMNISYSEVMYESDAKIMTDTWQTDKFHLSGETFTTGNYSANQQFFASSPSFSFPLQRLGTHIYLKLDSEIDSESWYDIAMIRVVNLRTGETHSIYTNYGKREREVEYIDLGCYHGCDIRLDFSFSSDSTFHGKGWSIYGVSIVGDKLLNNSVPKLKSFKKSIVSDLKNVEGNESPDENVDLKTLYDGVSIQLINVNYRNEREGTIGFTMTDAATNEYYQPRTIDSSHFKVKVGGKEVSICGQVQENQHNNVDVVYAVDCSGTMKSMQQTLSDNIRDLTKKFEEKFSAKYGAFLFGGTDTDCNYDVRPLTLANNFYLTPNADGSTERYYDVLDSITKHPFCGSMHKR